jgi:HEAT repeat protein
VFKLPPLPRTVAACEIDLLSEDAAVRKAVTVDLGRFSDDSERPRRVGLLVGALTDQNSEVRRQALLSLADLGDSQAVPAILSLLTDVEIGVRQIAVLALGELAQPDDAEVLGRLATLLRAGDASIRYQALLARCHLAPEDAAEDIAQGLTDGDPEIRELAIRLADEILLANQRPLPSALKDLVLRACEDRENRVRIVAQLFAGMQGWDAPRDMLLSIAARRIRVREPRDEQEAIRLCGELALRKSIPSLERRAYGLIGVSLDPFRWVALGALARLGEPQALQRLEKVLKSRRVAERAIAVEELGRSGRESALALLMPFRGHPHLVDPAILDLALERLGEGRAEPAENALKAVD